ncbi:PSP1 domain-containing protein [Thermincola ferriacetica]|uniref:PSP1 domain-containing protein n=1 Tax=Thermincola ferriacetica TaxID=281456 RepID=A0A0L6W0X2_9FIRM|nr:stage 0 sporulation family protein [Thermincola ferriacetica]KNZ69180.1 PSP1 domain-containing protein [Thermincola ferriacetica]
MIDVVGIRFKPAGKIYYFDPGGLEFEKDDVVIVETTRGIEAGYVVISNKKVEESEIVAPLKKVIRKATDVDLKQIEINKSKETKAFAICLEKIKEHGLPMKLVDVEYTFDANKIIFYFTADGRIDFRELVKDLAAIFRTRIELRQIGVRDEAKMLGGLGSCGRGLCCATFLGEFQPVSIRMAKDQNLSLNPTKISGICGRLMCCLKYENEAYEEERKLYPEVGTIVETSVGEGKIVGINILKKAVTVELKESKQQIDLTMDQIKVLCPKGADRCCRKNRNPEPEKDRIEDVDFNEREKLFSELE